jgi:hypothetical protein
MNTASFSRRLLQRISAADPSKNVHPILFQGGSNLLLTLQQSERGIKGWLWSLII